MKNDTFPGHVVPAIYGRGYMLLDAQENPSIAPELLEIVMLPLVRRKQVDDHIAVVEHQPALLRLSFDAALFLVILLGRFEDRLGKGIQHTVAGAVTYDKIIGERCNVFDVEKQDVFTLFVLQGGDDFVSKFECVQISPHTNR
jgi:hypothetical protein